MKSDKTCIHCGRKLINQKGVWICQSCNSRDLEYTQIFIEEKEDDGYVFIECPGATLYKDGTDEVESGARFMTMMTHRKVTRSLTIRFTPPLTPSAAESRRRRWVRFGVARAVRIIRCGCVGARARIFLYPRSNIPSARNSNRSST